MQETRQPLHPVDAAWIGLKCCEAINDIAALFSTHSSAFSSCFAYFSPLHIVLQPPDHINLAFLSDVLLLQYETIGSPAFPPFAVTPQRPLLQTNEEGAIFWRNNPDSWREEPKSRLSQAERQIASICALMMMLSPPQGDILSDALEADTVTDNEPNQWTALLGTGLQWFREGNSPTFSVSSHDDPFKGFQASLKAFCESQEQSPRSLSEIAQSYHPEPLSKPTAFSYADPLRDADGMERTAELRHILSTPPSLTNMLSLQKILSFWPQDEDINFALDYSLEHIHHLAQQEPPLSFHLRSSQNPSILERHGHAFGYFARFEHASHFKYSGDGILIRLKANQSDGLLPDIEFVPGLSLYHLLQDRHAFEDYSSYHFVVALGSLLTSQIADVLDSKEEFVKQSLRNAIIHLTSLQIAFDGTVHWRLPLGEPTRAMRFSAPLPLEQELVGWLGEWLFHAQTPHDNPNNDHPNDAFCSFRDAHTHLVLDRATHNLPPHQKEPFLYDHNWHNTLPQQLRSFLVEMIAPRAIAPPNIEECMSFFEEQRIICGIESPKRFLSGWLYYTRPTELVLSHYAFLLERNGLLIDY
jgi:hypothetical protein